MGMQTGNVYSGLDYFGANDTDWNLMGTEGNRIYIKAVSFPTEFSEVPVVRCALTGFSFIGGMHRINTFVTDTLVTGFNLRIQLWGDTQLAGCGIMWTAYDSEIWM